MGISVVTRSLQVGESGREGQSNVMLEGLNLLLLALKEEEREGGTHRQGMQVASRRWENEGPDSCLEPPEKGFLLSS